MNYIKYLIIVIVLSLSTIFIVTLNKAKCSFSNFLQVKKDINLKYAVESCKTVYKKYIYEGVKKIIYDSPIELALRRNKEIKYGLKYPTLKNEYYKGLINI